MAISVQMDTVELDEQDVETFPDQPGLASPNGIYDEPMVFPRIGNQYQVEIPALRTEVELAEQKENLTSIENTLTVQYDFGTGLAVPIMWAHHGSADVKVDQTEHLATSCVVETGSVDWASNKENPVDAEHSIMHGFPGGHTLYQGTHVQKSTYKVEVDLADNGKEFEGSTNHELRMPDNKMDMVSSPEKSRKVSYHKALPGSSSISWSDDETHFFLLGLYIFGKNLVKVRDFIECKSMGDILTFYYGKFYKSDAYRKWSECRKIKSRRCILGQRIFTGWRQQELLSRVLATVTNDVRDALLEATKKFNENKISFEEYITTLKVKGGVKALVDAVAIGKGKHDLTGVVSDPNRLNQVIPIRPEIPIGKACSSLSSGDIIKFLTGDFRLSKARSNDIFWEAVWPRLLAKGWHSEQPNDVSIASKHSLVFLIPGVKKFSRKRLVKGNHYFDSVTDVLSKVASDPRLLELEAEGSEGGRSNKDENGPPIEQDGLPNSQRQCYLQPKVPNCNSELMKFTVVDTSLVLGGPFKVRELRSLPLEVTNAYISLQNIGESSTNTSEQDSDDNSPERADCAPRPSNDTKLEQNNVCITGRDPLSLLSDAVAIVSSASSQINGHMCNDHFSGQVSANPPVKDVHCHLSGMSKPDEQVHSTPVTKRKRLAACKYEGTSRRAYPFSRNHQKTEVGNNDSVAMASNDIVAHTDTSLGDIHQNYSTNNISDEKVRFVPTEDRHNNTSITEATFRSAKPQSRTLIDLNFLPNGSLDNDCLPVPPEYGGGEHLRPEMVGSQLGANPEETLMLTEGTQHEDGPEAMEISTGLTVDQQVSETSRRQSTRNRPPTTRALEALACGFIGTKRRGRDNMVNRPSRRIRKTVETPPSIPQSNAVTCGASSELSNLVADENSQHASALNESIAQSDRKPINEFLSMP